MNEAVAYIEKNRQAFVERLKELLRFPSVSADPAYKEDVSRCAEHVRKMMESMGIKTEIFPTEGHPIVYGEYMKPGNKHTLLCYGHYDVQPAVPLELWDHPPFEPHIEGENIYARGACDDKGQFLTHLFAAEAFLKTSGDLPVNCKFLIEGEEEATSDNLELFVKANRDKLKADGVLVSDTGMYGKGIPAITYGLRGIAAAEIKVSGPSKDLHSGSFGGSVANPANELARVVSSLHDDDMRIRILGFYDKVTDLDDWERRMFAELPFDEGAYLESTGSPATAGERGYTSLERKWGRPTCDVNGIYGGYAGDGPKTIIPSWAGCKVTMRLVPDQDPDDTLDKFERHVKENASEGVKVEITRQGGAKPAIVSRENFLVKGGADALKKGFGKEPVFIREGGSIPIVNVFKEELGLDTLLLGFAGPDDNAHSPNEKFSLDTFHKGIITVAHFMSDLE